MRIRFSALVIITLAGCKAHQEPLDKYLIQLKRQAQVDIVALEPVFDTGISRYTSAHLRHPFELPEDLTLLPISHSSQNCENSLPSDQQGPLVHLKANQLRLKGVLNQAGGVSALIEVPTGQLVKVDSGQPMALMNGAITEVSMDRVWVQEFIVDGFGCWQKHDTQLALK